MLSAIVLASDHSPWIG